MKKMEKKLFIPWVISLAVTVVCIFIVVLNSRSVLALSDGARSVLALSVSAAMIVLGYTSCKHAGVLKNQKQRK